MPGDAGVVGSGRFQDETPGHGDLILETKSQAKTLSFLLTNNLVLGKASPIRARWLGNARCSEEPTI